MSSLVFYQFMINWIIPFINTQMPVPSQGIKIRDRLGHTNHPHTNNLEIFPP